MSTPEKSLKPSDHKVGQQLENVSHLPEVNNPRNGYSEDFSSAPVADLIIREQEVIGECLSGKDPEHDEDMRVLMLKGLDRYPINPYHNREHGVDVIDATRQLADQYGIFTPHGAEMLVVAAAWHDAGFGDPEASWRPYGSKEGYAVHLFEEAAGKSMRSENKAFVRRAIMGTHIDSPREDVAGQLLHMADLSYIWGSWETFLHRALAYKQEEQSDMPWDDFKNLQEKFLGAYQQKVRDYMEGSQLGQAYIDGRVASIQQNLDRILSLPEEPTRQMTRALGGAALARS